MARRLDAIVSGGQTGVDRAALDVAIELGIPHGGWCPAGRLAEDGPIPARYALRETESPAYTVRTERNVRDSDGTLVLASGVPRGGSALTCELARAHRKPLLVVDLAAPPVPATVRDWLAAHAIRRLNVAGPRASTEAGVYERAAAYLRTLLATVSRARPTEIGSDAVPSDAEPTIPAAEELRAAAQLLRGARRLVVLTGAGISTESGIPDFRSPGGLWSRYDPTELTFQRFCASAETRRRYWEMGAELYPVLKAAQPNAAHRFLAALEHRGGLRRLVTQNIDGLHQRAGSSAERVIEIHGTALEVACLSCGARQDRDPVQARFAAGDLDPRCSCNGLLKPATISFGQAMPERETAMALADAAEADVFLVVGSSLVVYPAASLPGVALEHGAELVIINREPTPYDHVATLALQGGAGAILSAVATELGLSLADA